MTGNSVSGSLLACGTASGAEKPIVTRHQDRYLYPSLPIHEKYLEAQNGHFVAEWFYRQLDTDALVKISRAIAIPTEVLQW